MRKTMNPIPFTLLALTLVLSANAQAGEVHQYGAGTNTCVYVVDTTEIKHGTDGDPTGATGADLTARLEDRHAIVMRDVFKQWIAGVVTAVSAHLKKPADIERILNDARNDCKVTPKSQFGDVVIRRVEVLLD